MSGKVTMVEVAKQARTSTATVSLVLNGRDRALRISPATRERVLEVARKLQYNPGRKGRRGRRTQAAVGVAILMPHGGRHFHEYFHDFYLAICKAAADLGYMLCAELGVETGDEAAMLGQGLMRRTRGLLLLALVDPDAALVEVLDAIGKPYVIVNRPCDPPRPCVLSDQHRRGYQQARRLYCQGHRRVVFLDISAGSRSWISNERYLGALEAAREHGCENDLAYFAASHDEPADFHRNVEEMLARHPDATGVVFSWTYAGYLAIDCLQRRGLRVPQDISLVSCDTTFSNTLYEPGIDTFLTPKQEMGRRATELLHRLLQGRPAAQPPRVEVPAIHVPAPSHARARKRRGGHG